MILSLKNYIWKQEYSNIYLIIEYIEDIRHDCSQYSRLFRYHKSDNHHKWLIYWVWMPLLDALEFWPYQHLSLYTLHAFISLASNIVTICADKGPNIDEICSTDQFVDIWYINVIFCIPSQYQFMLNRWIFPCICVGRQLCPNCAVFVSNWTLTNHWHRSVSQSLNKKHLYKIIKILKIFDLIYFWEKFFCNFELKSGNNFLFLLNFLIWKYFCEI